MTTDLTTRITELTAQIEEHLSEDEAAAQAAARGTWTSGEGTLYAAGNQIGEVWTVPESSDEDYPEDPGTAAHIARHGPLRVLCRVKATRSLVAAILARPHVRDDSDWYGCQAITVSCYDTDGSRFPEPEGRRVPSGRECTCGRDEDVARLLAIAASEWEA